ncbi:MAG: glycosyl hydrolase, partial [Chthoniobacteraceae bacterium]
MLARALAAFFLILPLLAPGQTLNLHDDVQTVATLTNTTATLSGKAELHVTGTGDPLTGSTIHLNSEDAWFFLPNIGPSQVVSTFLSRVRVSGATAVVDSNVRVAQYASGTVIIPHAADFAPMEVFEGRGFTGTAKRLRPYVEYGNVTLGELQGAISSFRLKRGYTATIAQNENGTGISRNYVAQDGDLEVSALPAGLDNRVRFVRIFPWRWASKKGIGGNIASGLKVGWYYNWNLDQNSSRDLEYVPIRQTRWWPGLDQNWRTRGATHLLGYNEPDRPDQANMSVADAISGWPDLVATGLRLGAPAVSDGGLSWLYSFIDQADAAGLRVDYVPVHYYRCFGNANDPVGAANQLYSFLKGIHDRVKRPLWVTEWNNGANWTSCADPTFAQQQATVSEILKMLDDAPFVERHAIFNWVEDVRRVKWDDGSLTAAGTAYRDKLSPISYQQEVPDSGLASAAHFPFSGDLRDALLNGHDGMAVGAPRLTPGKYGQALTLDGATDYVQVSAGLGDSTDFTFAGWVKWGGGAGWQRIFDFGDGTSRFLFLSPRTSGGNLRFAINTGSGEQQLSAPPLTPGVWTHVA